MLTLLYGAFGTGKTEHILHAIQRDIEAEIPSYLIVPEQSTVSMEAVAARRLPPSAPLLFEVTNFTRLADTVFRLVGGIAAHYADEATTALLARDAIAAVSNLLTDRRRADPRRIAEVIRAVRECKISAVPPEKLNAAADALEDDPRLSAKLRDLSLLLSAFEATMEAHRCVLPADGLAHLAKALSVCNPLAGAHLYFDGFTSFTALQRAVLAPLFRTCEVTVSLPLPADGKPSFAFAEPERTERDLCRLAAECDIPTKRVDLKETHRQKPPVLRALAERLFRLTPTPLPPPVPEDTGALRIFECRTPYGEAELVAADIARRVREGAHYRDFAIIARTAESYRGILDTALAREGIPAYFSLPTDLSAFEAVKLIHTAYAILVGGGRREDVITYLKCGLSGIAPDAQDRFELYAERWALRGDALLKRPFRMPPGGYEAATSLREKEKETEALRELNETRRILLAPLRILEKSCKENVTIKEHATTLYEFLSALRVDELLFEKAKEYADNGEPERADEYARLFGAITEALDLLVEFIPETVISASDFSELLGILFSTKSLRTIPTRADAVTVGSADLLRPGEPKHVYLIGVDADVFPRSGSEGGTFTSEEIGKLAALDIILDGDDLVRASREYYCFLRAFCAASESVTLSYYLNDFSYALAGRSEALDRILALTDNRFPIQREDELPLFDRIFSVEDALRTLGLGVSPAEAAAIATVLGAVPGAPSLAERAASPLSDTEARVDEATMHALFGNKLALTQSRLEKYAACPFSYFCHYILRLSDGTRITMNNANIGTFIHAIMEHFFSRVSREALLTMDEKEIEATVAEITERYLAELFPDAEEITPRIRHLFLRLTRRAVLLVGELQKEAEASEFLPLFFEYEPSETDESAASPPRILLDDGTAVTLYGKIDRVDVYHRDGNAYLRVIDYKTGTKSFSLRDFRRGQNLQMLIYLFALWRTDRTEFLRTVGVAEGGKILPAGVLYLNLSLGNRSVATPSTMDSALCTRSGLLLNDTDAILAMDRDGKGTYLPIKLDREGAPTATRGGTLATLEEMGALAAEVEDVIATLATRLTKGVGDAVPLRHGNKSPCEYCEYSPICRHTAANRDAEENGKKDE